jgi:hypothetical protein
LHDHKRDKQDAENRRDHQKDAADDIGEHVTDRGGLRAPP